MRNWQRANRDRVRESHRKWYLGHKRNNREYGWRALGIIDGDADVYDRSFAMQGGGCAICGRPPARNKLHLDHDHATGEARGLLCCPCNRLLGWLDGYGSRVGKYLAYPPYKVAKLICEGKIAQ